MSRVEIEAGGRRVVVDHTGELAHLAATAAELWQATEGAQPGPVGGVGFTGSQTWQAPPAPSNMRRNPAPVRAADGSDR